MELDSAPNKKVAAQLGITEHTLRNAFSTINSKLNVANRLQLFALALHHLPS